MRKGQLFTRPRQDRQGTYRAHRRPSCILAQLPAVTQAYPSPHSTDRRACAEGNFGLRKFADQQYAKRRADYSRVHTTAQRAAWPSVHEVCGLR